MKPYRKYFLKRMPWVKNPTLPKRSENYVILKSRMEIGIQNQLFILGGLFIVGSALMAWFVLGLSKGVKKLYGASKEGDLSKNLIGRLARTEAMLEEFEPRLETIEKISKISVQKVGFLRFNPFQDTGGDQSFLLILLDRENSGVVISSLYTREGVRIFAKQVEKGKSKHKLSEEEKSVLEETINKGIGPRP